MRSIRTLLLVHLLAACGAGPAATDGFPAFWSEFTAALSADDAGAVARLTRFPFLLEGEERDSTAHMVLYDALFTPPARACLAAATPLLEDDRYVAFCGPVIYYFERRDDGWRFTEFAADPEAEGGDAGAVDSAELGSWRVVDGRPAPWRPAGSRAAGAGLRGSVVAVAASHVSAAPPLGCADAQVEFVVTPAEGLFQGNLGGSAAASARELGIPVPSLTMRVTCDAGVFDYHHLPGDTLLVGLDDVIWKLAPGPATPATTVRSLLAAHMTGPMVFTPDAVAALRAFLSPALSGRVAEYFARPIPADEVPPINGDPFTDSQEAPDGFAFAATTSEGERAIVRVVFAFGGRTRPVEFVLTTHAAGWLLEDVRYDDGSTLVDILGR